jgi:hypothetical protein
MLHLNLLEKQAQAQSQINNLKEKIKIRAEMNKLGTERML